MKVQNHKPLHEAWVIFFCLGVVMLNYPFLHIFNKDTPIFGIPLLVIYLMIGWPLSIVVVYIFAVYLGKEADDGPSTTELPRDEETP